MAAADTTPPTLTSLTFPATIDATTYPSPYGPPGQLFVAGASDTGTGVDHVTITLDRFRYPSSDGNTITIGGSRALFAEGPQSAGAAFDPRAGNGTYNIASVAVADHAGNIATYTPDQLHALGIATSFIVDSPTAADLVAPTLGSLGLPGTIDVRQGGANVTLLAFARDAGSGPATGQLTLDNGIGPVTLYQNGNALNGSFSLYTDAQPGTYHVTAATVTDAQGNSRGYTADQLAALGTQTSFTVRSDAAPDTTAPILTALTLPSIIDVTHGGVAVPIRADVTEDGSGVAQIAVSLDHAITIDYPTHYSQRGNVPSGGPAPIGTIAGAVPGAVNSGTTVSLAQTGGSYTLTYDNGTGNVGVPVSALTAAGTYHVTGVTVTDKAGNSSHYDAGQLAALGANTVVQVAADGSAPTLTGFSITPIVTRGGAVTIAVGAIDAGTGPVEAVVHTSYAFSNFYNDGYDASHLAITGFTNGTASLAENIDSSVPTGTISIADLILGDGAGNSTLYTADQLHALGYATSFKVAGNAPADFDGNGPSDLLWRNDDGAVSIWSSDGSGMSERITQDTYYAGVAPSWHPVETFDWSGDGRSDILWRKDDGAVAIWTGTAGGFNQGAYLDDSVPISWHIAATGDVDGNGGGDILWRNDDGSLSTWLAAGTGFQKNAWYHGPVDAGWKVEGLGDFNGDGKADILWRNTNGAVSVWSGTGSGFQETGSLLTAPVDRAWHVAGIGDFDGDGRDDILWRNDNGQVTVWQGNGAANGFDRQRLEASAPIDWHVAAVGDYNGDHLADILWRNDAGAISIWNATGTGWQQNAYYDASVGQNWALTGHVFPL